MVEAVIWMAGLSILLMFLMIPAAVHVLRTVLVAEERAEPDYGTGASTRESPSHRGGAGT